MAPRFPFFATSTNFNETSRAGTWLGCCYVPRTPVSKKLHYSMEDQLNQNYNYGGSISPLYVFLEPSTTFIYVQAAKTMAGRIWLQFYINTIRQHLYNIKCIIGGS
jgi:hypothetical protein